MTRPRRISDTAACSTASRVAGNPRRRPARSAGCAAAAGVTGAARNGASRSRVARATRTGSAGAPAAKKAQTLKELSRHTENARKDFDRGVSALQKKKFDEAERNFSDLIQKYPDEKELVDRARVYLAICERQKRSAEPAISRLPKSTARSSATDVTLTWSVLA